MTLAIQSLRKVYSDGVVALEDFTWELERGVHGLLGPNGAGKSTLLEILALNLMPTAGAIAWDGLDVLRHPRPYRNVLGYLPQSHGFHPTLTASATLDFLGRLQGLDGRRLRRRIDECLQIVGLSHARRRRVGGFSGGMRQRLAIAQALLHEPRLLIIDEPTTGLDPEERVAFRNMLFEMGERALVLLSTHIVKDVEFSCGTMTILYEGRQRFAGEPAELLRCVEGRVFVEEIPVDEFDEFSSRCRVVSIRERPGAVEVRYLNAAGTAPRPAAALATPNLEDAYVQFADSLRRDAPPGVTATATGNPEPGGDSE